MTTLPFELAVRVPGKGSGFRIVDVTQDGAPCAFWTGAQRLVVAPITTSDQLTLRVRYEGEVYLSDSDYVRGDESVLRSDGRWLPLLPETQAGFDVSVRYPEAFRVFGQGTATESATTEGWSTTRFVVEGENGFTLYGAPAYVTRDFRVGDTAVTVAVWPNDAAAVEPLREVAERSLQRVVGALGAYPLPSLNIVETGWNQGRSGYGAVSNVSVGWRQVRETVDAAFVAHELSHGWWGGRVPLAHEARENGQWNESFAEYTSAFALEPEATLAQRQEWSRGYASLVPEKDRPMVKVGTASANWDVHSAVTYEKGALVLTALEDRIGTRDMLAFLKAFSTERAGRASTWEDILSVLAATNGSDNADWLRTWISTTSAPQLRLQDVTATKGTVSGRLTQQESSPFSGRVELGCYEDAAQLDSTWVAFSGPETSFAMRCPKSTNRIVLDPRFRLPRRYSPDADPLADGREVGIAR